jgi:hypothetical protein
MTKVVSEPRQEIVVKVYRVDGVRYRGLLSWSLLRVATRANLNDTNVRYVKLELLTTTLLKMVNGALSSSVHPACGFALDFK